MAIELYGPPLPPKKKKSAWSGVKKSQPKPTQEAINVAAAQAPPISFGGPNISAAELNARLPMFNIAAQDPRRDRWQADLKEQEQAKKGTTQNLYMTPDQLGELTGAVEQLPIIQGQKRDEAAMHNYAMDVAAAQPTGQIDISPLMALTDAWTGSKFAQSYSKPDNMQGAKLLLAYGDKLNKARQDRNEMILKAAQQMKSGTATDQLTNALGLGYVAGQQPLPAPRSAGSGRGTATDEKFIISNTGKIRKDFQDANSRLGALEVALKNGDLMSIRRSLALAARELSGEKGVLTEQDVGRILPKTIGMDAAAFEAYILNDPNVDLSPHVVKNLLAETQRARKTTTQRYKTAMKAFEDQIRGSVSMGNLPSLNAIFKPDESIIQVPPEPKKETISDLFKQFKASQKK